MTSSHSKFNALSDDQLLVELKQLANVERHATAELLRCLMEVDSRRLYLHEGCSSLFTYCTQVIHLSESAAYNRIEAARTARRLPALLDAIADGAITLTSARLLAPHLTLDNHHELLSAASHKSKREVEALIARIAPKPPAQTVLQKLPSRPGPISPVVEGSIPALSPPPLLSSGTDEVPPTGNATMSRTPSASQLQRNESPRTPSRPRIPPLTPLSSDAYKLQVTITAETEDKLRRARDLLRHSIPDGDVAAVLDRALTLLLEDLEKRRCAVVMKPRPQACGTTHARRIPAAVKREVWRRDGGRCAFSSSSRRCSETAFLEFHHVVPYAEGGEATVSNIELRCRAHNQYESALFFGWQNGEVRESAATW